ncbi:MAG: homoserine O-succinyltransferase [Acidimicrobiales bacterium]|jgi:homoserine O-succinyltransferase
MRIAFVNNMPDAAFEETEQQFLRLVCPIGPESGLQVSRYLMGDIDRAPEIAGQIRHRYQPVETLFSDPPDAIIVTGTEPRCADLTSEPYWPALSELLAWAEKSVPVTLLSCLASHGALLALDGVERRPLPVKLSGVYPQELHPSHDLVKGLDSVSFPHSRLNDVPAELLGERGYVVLVGSATTGWTVAARERDGRLLMLLQGHPEYGPTTLLREYRRDVRRFLDGTSSVYPRVPEGYLDAAGVALVERFRRAVQGAHPPDMAKFPFEAAARRIAVDWQAHSVQLVRNWRGEAERRAGRLAGYR